MKIITFLSLLVTLSGCGIARFHEESYPTDNFVVYDSQGTRVWLYVSSTNKTREVFPFYYSDFRSSPYSIYIRAQSNIDGVGLISVDQVYLTVQPDAPIGLEFPVQEFSVTPPANNTKYSEGSIKLPLDDLLVFKEGKEVDVCVVLSLDGRSTGKLCRKYVGTLVKDIMSNFWVYMSV